MYYSNIYINVLSLFESPPSSSLCPRIFCLNTEAAKAVAFRPFGDGSSSSESWELELQMRIRALDRIWFQNMV